MKCQKQTNTHRCSGLFFWHHLPFICVLPAMSRNMGVAGDLRMSIFKTRSCQGGLWYGQRILLCISELLLQLHLNRVYSISSPRTSQHGKWPCRGYTMTCLIEFWHSFLRRSMKLWNSYMTGQFQNSVFGPIVGFCQFSPCNSVLLMGWRFSQSCWEKILGFSKKHHIYLRLLNVY